MAGKGRAVDRGQGMEEMREVTTEVGKDGGILVQSDVFADQFDGQDLAIGELGLRAALAQSMRGYERREIVVKQAKHRYYERIQVRGESARIDGLAITTEGALARVLVE